VHTQQARMCHHITDHVRLDNTAKS